MLFFFLVFMVGLFSLEGGEVEGFYTWFERGNDSCVRAICFFDFFFPFWVHIVEMGILI